MAKDIFVIKTMGDALRNTGYKNIECAMSELLIILFRLIQKI